MVIGLANIITEPTVHDRAIYGSAILLTRIWYNEILYWACNGVMNTCMLTKKHIWWVGDN